MSTVFITGANRGLGLEFCRQYLAAGWRVIATCREPRLAEKLDSLSGDINVLQLDVTDFKEVEKTAKTLGSEKIDVLINNAGIYGSRETEFGETDFDDWVDVFRVNTQAPLKIVESFVGLVASSEKKVIVSISSLLGSVMANDSGGQYVYRSSKAALNALNKCLAIDLAGKDIIAIVVSPGWVRTDMGGANAHLDPVDSVSGIRKLIDRLTLGDSGRFFNHDGKSLDW